MQSTKQYAALHDFCMTIPYAAIVSLLGLKGVVAHQCRFATVFLFAGVASCISSALSLKTWKAGESNTRYTLASSGRYSTNRWRNGSEGLMHRSGSGCCGDGME